MGYLELAAEFYKILMDEYVEKKVQGGMTREEAVDAAHDETRDFFTKEELILFQSLIKSVRDGN